MMAHHFVSLFPFSTAICLSSKNILHMQEVEMGYFRSANSGALLCSRREGSPDNFDLIKVKTIPTELEIEFRCVAAAR